jgi:hypothetical protein
VFIGVYLRNLDFSFVKVFHVFHCGILSYDTAKNCLNLFVKIILFYFYSVVIQFLIPVFRTLQILLRLIHLINSIRYFGTRAVLRFSEV